MSSHPKRLQAKTTVRPKHEKVRQPDETSLIKTAKKLNGCKKY